MDDNPCMIQSGSQASNLPVKTPLVLFHDAGGTVVQYFSLGDLNRPLYGMSNLHFEQGGHWEHGIREMGVVYTQRLRSVIGSGKVLLGGWSLGGCIALEVAARLMRLPQYTVVGIVLIDSVFPSGENTRNYPMTVEEVARSFPSPKHLSDTRRATSQTCILNAHNMHRAWQLPHFPGNIPQTVLLQASDRISPSSESPHYLDIVRDRNRHLGWEEHESEFLSQCLVVPGNHFTIFNRQELTVCIQHACATLEGNK